MDGVSALLRLPIRSPDGRYSTPLKRVSLTIPVDYRHSHKPSLQDGWSVRFVEVTHKISRREIFDTVITTSSTIPVDCRHSHKPSLQDGWNVRFVEVTHKISRWEIFDTVITTSSTIPVDYRHSHKPSLEDGWGCPLYCGYP